MLSDLGDDGSAVVWDNWRAEAMPIGYDEAVVLVCRSRLTINGVARRRVGDGGLGGISNR